MRKVYLALALLFWIALSLGPVAAIRGGEELLALSGMVWVTNRTQHTVARYDAATGVVTRIAPVERAPIGILVPPGTGKVYVSNEGSNTVSVLSAASMTPLKTITTGPRPHHMMYDASGRFVYVAEYESNQVGVIDTQTDTRIAGLPASQSSAARTHASWPTRDGLLYAVSEVSNELAAIDTRTRSIAWTLPIGNRPSEVLVTPDGHTAYVSIRNENKVKVVDLQRRGITGETTVGVQPDTLQLTTDRRTLIIGLRGVPAQLAFVDTTNLQVTWVDVGGTTTGHQWLTEDGRFTFVAVEGPGDLGSVAVVDNTRRKLITAYPYPGGGRPHGAFYEVRR
ncbi:MAG: beta-propeller fold lactonase family protein [bacterium]